MPVFFFQEIPEVAPEVDDKRQRGREVDNGIKGNILSYPQHRLKDYQMSGRRDRQKFSQPLDDPQKKIVHFLDSFWCQRARSGGATKMDEYAPIANPTRRVRENSRNGSPPKIKRQDTINRTVNTVLIERAIVSQMEILTTSLNFFLARLGFFRFSRIRSKMTIVSLIEYPIIVRIAATKVTSTCRQNKAIIPVVMIAS